MKLLKALRSAATEFRRSIRLDGWELGETYTYPEQVTPSGFRAIELLTRLRIADRDVLLRVPADSLWRVTLDRDGQGNYLAGVAVCVSHDSERDVIRMEQCQ